MRRKIIYVEHTRPQREPYGFWGFAGDLFMTFVTGGLWLIWIFVREMRGR